jgi:PKD repeat protein
MYFERLIPIGVLLLAMVAARPGSVLSQEIKVRPAEFNSDFMDFAPTYFRNGVVFCSNRTQKVYEDDIDSLGFFYTDLFFVEIDKNGRARSEPSLLSKDLTTFLNEGPSVFNRSQDRIYYTTNIEPDKKEKRKRVREYRLGIFTARVEGDRFTSIEALPFNTTTYKFNCMHPAISPDDRILVFASNMEQKSNPDLYYCQWQAGKWSEPKNMGSTINTSKSEIFPFFGSNGRLFFASNRQPGRKDFDIYYSDYVDDQWTKPIALPAPINSKFDDYAYAEDPSGARGFFSSNRGSDTDNIFSFEHIFPSMPDCRKNGRPTYCYLIEDEEIMKLDSLPLRYEWDLGDGTKMPGISVKHCYADTGTYVVSLNIIDTTTKQLFINVSQSELQIRKSLRPYMSVMDTVLMGQEVSLNSDVSERSRDTWYYWASDDGGRYVGGGRNHVFNKSGKFSMMLGAVYPDSVGGNFGGCSYKAISVYRNLEELALARQERASVLMAQRVISEKKLHDKRVPLFRTLDSYMEPTNEEVMLRLTFDYDRQELREDIEEFKFDLRKPKEIPFSEEEISATEIDMPDEMSSVVLIHKLDISGDVLMDYYLKRQGGKQVVKPTPIKTKPKTEQEREAEKQLHARQQQEWQAKQLSPSQIDKEDFESEFATNSYRKLKRELELNEMLVNVAISFESAKSDLSPKALSDLKYVSVILEIEPDARLKMVVKLPEGKSRRQALELSSARFEQIKNYMTSLRLDESRLEWGSYDDENRSLLMGGRSDEEEVFSDEVEFRLILKDRIEKVSE